MALILILVLGILSMGTQDPPLPPTYSASLSVVFDKTSFRPDEPLTIGLNLTNIGEEPFYVQRYISIAGSMGTVGNYVLEVKKEGGPYHDTYHLAGDPFYPVGWVPPTDEELAAKGQIVLLDRNQSIGREFHYPWQDVLPFFRQEYRLPGKYTVRARYVPLPIPKRPFGRMLSKEVVSPDIEINVLP